MKRTESFEQQYIKIKQMVAFIEAEARGGRAVPCADVVMVCELFFDVCRIHEASKKAIDEAAEAFHKLIKTDG